MNFNVTVITQTTLCLRDSASLNNIYGLHIKTQVTLRFCTCTLSWSVMAILQFMITWIYPIILLPFNVISTWIRITLSTVESDSNQAKVLDVFTESYSNRMAKRKKYLMLDTVAQVREDLRRPVRVLEVGCGSKANFPFYPPGTKVVCLEPNPKCEVYLRKYAEQFDDVTLEAFHVGYGEDMKVVESNSVDVVVTTLTLCTVNDVDQTLKEIIRVLKEVSKTLSLNSYANNVSVIFKLFVEIVISFALCLSGCCLNVDARSRNYFYSFTSSNTISFFVVFSSHFIIT